MAITSSENYTGRTLTRAASGDWKASRNWTITGANTETQCLSATPIDNAPLAQLQNTHPQNVALKVDNHTFSQTGPFTWNVVANYLIPSSEILSGADKELLNRKTTILWRKGSYSVAVDRDINGNPLSDAAGSAFDPPEQRTFKIRLLKITRWEPYFDIEKSAKFEDTLNANLFKVGPIEIQPGECLCTGIEPAAEYPVDAIAIPISYDFEIRRLYIGAKTVAPYRIYKKNQGRRGWYNDGALKSGEFVSSGGDQVSVDVPLDAQGKPLDTTIKVSTGPGTTATPVAAPSGGAQAKIVAEMSNANITVLGFDFLRSEDFTGLGL
jgi:hypothetical protein